MNIPQFDLRLTNVNRFQFVVYSLANVGQEERHIVGVSAFHQTQVGDVTAQRSLQNSLQQTSWRDFNANCVLRHMLNSFVE